MEGPFRYVLPTHHMFLLAERIPTTVPDLLSLFGGHGGVSGNIPTVLKRRTGELLAVIKGAMEAAKSASSLQGPGEDRHQEGELVVSTAVEELETMTLSSSPSKVTNESRLWTVTSSPTSATTISISCSSLFGAGISGERVQTKKGVTPRSSVHGEQTYFAARSTLFGSALAEVSPCNPKRVALVSFLSPTSQVSCTSSRCIAAPPVLTLLRYFRLVLLRRYGLAAIGPL